MNKNDMAELAKSAEERINSAGLKAVKNRDTDEFIDSYRKLLETVIEDYHTYYLYGELKKDESSLAKDDKASTRLNSHWICAADGNTLLGIVQTFDAEKVMDGSFFYYFNSVVSKVAKKAEIKENYGNIRVGITLPEKDEYLLSKIYKCLEAKGKTIESLSDQDYEDIAIIISEESKQINPKKVKDLLAINAYIKPESIPLPDDNERDDLIDPNSGIESILDDDFEDSCKRIDEILKGKTDIQRLKFSLSFTRRYIEGIIDSANVSEKKISREDKLKNHFACIKQLLMTKRDKCSKFICINTSLFDRVINNGNLPTDKEISKEFGVKPSELSKVYKKIEDEIKERKNEVF